MSRRRLEGVTAPILALDAQRRELSTMLQAFQAQRKAVSHTIGQLVSVGLPIPIEQREQNISTRDNIVRCELELTKIQRELYDALINLPNILDVEVPAGADETENLELKYFGSVPAFPFTPREHFEIGLTLKQMDFITAAKLSGSRFTLLYGSLARLERALGQFMIDLHTLEHGYTEVSVPLLVNRAAVYGTSQLPKFAADLFQTTDDRWLIPTAEIPLTNMAAGEILAEADLPIRVTALSDCFRSEAGSAGRDTRGMLRQHQFKKVELVSLVRPEDSDAEHERMTRCAETVLERLELPYRRMLLCSGDTGFGAARTHDLEVWLPGQGAWREISSCSNMRAFQARRMDARWRAAESKAVSHLHTLNGSGVAVGRALVAVLEHGQRADGSVAVPEVLRPYMGGVDRIAVER